jgi:maltose O-acetyltransferase
MEMNPFRQLWLNSVCGCPLFTTRVRLRLLRAGGIDIGAAGIFPHAVFVSGYDVKVHDNVFVNVGVLFDAGARIELEPGVRVGPRAQFLTSTHPLGPPSCRAGGGETQAKPILIGEGTWIGAGAIILSGVTIGRGCVVGAGAVVVRDCEPNGLYVGVPAARRSELPEQPGALTESHFDHLP